MTREFPIYQVDAFTDAVFAGNPAAVVPLGAWLADAEMQTIAAENNLSETAFILREGGDYAIRWFTPANEVDLCGHATLASAFVLFEILQPGRKEVAFRTVKAGTLHVARRDDGSLALDFPSRPPERIAVPEGLAGALGARPSEVWAARDVVAVFDSAAEIAALTPDMRRLAALDTFAVMVTAPGDDGIDFVSRFFAPRQGIDEDPVTGSAHCTLIPFWAKRLRRKSLTARQVSLRGGTLSCEDRGERVSIAGHAVLYLEGRIFLP
jgi:PhzF family phenazine biosynthesis protein